MEELDVLRSEIDDIDRELVHLFEKRMEIALRIAEYKNKNNLPIFSEEREREVIRKNISILKNKDLSDETEDFFKSMFKISKSVQLKRISNYDNE